jgi:2-polyprenyl-3-methyl-5-hydroxy-6-metoxy-1,4-benzoquinol methylase
MRGNKMIVSPSIEHVPCPLGCPKGDETVLTGRDLLHELPGEFTVVKCRTCGLMRTNPRPSSDTIGLYYPDDYGPYLGTQVRQTKTTSGIKKLLKPLANRIFNPKTQELPTMAPTRMLEIGCASGAFLHQMAGQGWQVEGIEFSEKAAQAASKLGYKVHAGSLESAPAPEQPFDLIVGWMVLEHLHDPIGCLRKLHEWANNSAWLVLSVPNANSISFRFFKDKWYDLHLPNHLYHFTPQTLQKVLESGGWTLERVHHQRSLINLIESTAYVAESKGWPRLGRWLHDFAMRGGKWFYIQFPIAWILSVLGQTGRMTVWARRHEEPALRSRQNFATLAPREAQ